MTAGYDLAAVPSPKAMRRDCHMRLAKEVACEHPYARQTWYWLVVSENHEYGPLEQGGRKIPEVAADAETATTARTMQEMLVNVF